MTNKAPDTRNKLDNNKNIKKQKNHYSSQSKKNNPKKKWNPKNLKEVMEDPKQEKKPKKITKGEKFRKEHGYSLTIHKLMKKYKVSTIEEYKFIRKKRKETEKKLRQKKHLESVAYKRSNGKKKGSKGSTPATKIKKKQA